MHFLGEVFSDELCEGKLTFAQFNVDKVLSASQTLLGSSGDEYKLPLEVEGAFVFIYGSSGLNLFRLWTDRILK